MLYMQDNLDQETIVQKERSHVYVLYMKNQVDQETIVQKERSDVHMSYMKERLRNHSSEGKI